MQPSDTRKMQGRIGNIINIKDTWPRAPTLFDKTTHDEYDRICINYTNIIFSMFSLFVPKFYFLILFKVFPKISNICKTSEFSRGKIPGETSILR